MGKASKKLAKNQKKNKSTELKAKITEYKEAGNIKEALDVVVALFNLKCYDVEVLFAAAELYFLDGDYERAVVWADKTMEFEPAHVGARILLSQICFLQERVPDGLSVLEFILVNGTNLLDVQQAQIQKVLEQFSECEDILAPYPHVCEFLRSSNNSESETEIVDSVITEKTENICLDKTEFFAESRKSKPAQIIFMNGGLGNQIFQYIFMRWLEIRLGTECIIDDSEFFGENVPHNGYQLENLFGIKKRRLSEYFGDEAWQIMLSQKKEKNIAQQLLDLGMPISMIFEAGTLNFSGNVVQVTTKNVVSLKFAGQWYFYGYWLEKTFFEAISELIRQEIVFPKIEDSKNKAYQDQIVNTESVGIHIRRGDMVAMGWSMDASYFRDTIQYFMGNTVNAQYFVFSDDLPWCKEHRSELGLDYVADCLTFVEGNDGEFSYRDLQLMAMCKHLIGSHSSFSLLAAVLNTNENKIVVNP